MGDTADKPDERADRTPSGDNAPPPPTDDPESDATDTAETAPGDTAEPQATSQGAPSTGDPAPADIADQAQETETPHHDPAAPAPAVQNAAPPPAAETPSGEPQAAPHPEPEPGRAATAPDDDFAPPPTGSDAAQRPPRGGLIAAGALIVATLLLTGIVFGAMWLTGQWDGPSSDDPAESVDGFLTALLEDRDAEETGSYLCRSMAGDIDAAMDLLDVEADGAGFTWGDVKELSRTGDTAVVTAKVTFELTGDTSTWTFAVVTGDPDDLWRVCGIDTGTGSES